VYFTALSRFWWYISDSTKFNTALVFVPWRISDFLPLATEHFSSHIAITDISYVQVQRYKYDVEFHPMSVYCQNGTLKRAFSTVEDRGRHGCAWRHPEILEKEGELRSLGACLRRSRLAERIVAQKLKGLNRQSGAGSSRRARLSCAKLLKVLELSLLLKELSPLIRCHRHVLSLHQTPLGVEVATSETTPRMSGAGWQLDR
jgi:hypothetical protein